jgi:hypothetical protein
MNTPANYPMFVSIDGLYGSAEDILKFNHGALTEEQWLRMEQLHDTDKHRYVTAILDNDPDELAFFEEDE